MSVASQLQALVWRILLLSGREWLVLRAGYDGYGQEVARERLEERRDWFEERLRRAVRREEVDQRIVPRVERVIG